jgi:hypothetical protein
MGGIYGDEVTSAVVTKRRVIPVSGLQSTSTTPIAGTDAAIVSAQVNKTRAPFAVDARCRDFASMGVVDALGHSVVTTSGASSAAQEVSDPSALVPTAQAGELRVILTSSTDAQLACGLRLRSFNEQKLAGSSTRKLVIEANRRYNAYPIQLAADSVVTISKLGTATADLECPGMKVVRSGSSRLLAFVPRDRPCVLSVARLDPPEKPVSFPLHIFPISRQ